MSDKLEKAFYLDEVRLTLDVMHFITELKLPYYIIKLREQFEFTELQAIEQGWPNDLLERYKDYKILGDIEDLSELGVYTNKTMPKKRLRDIANTAASTALQSAGVSEYVTIKIGERELHYKKRYDELRHLIYYKLQEAVIRQSDVINIAEAN